jgi:hypothetical protein
MVGCVGALCNLISDMHPADWRLEHFVADLLLECEPDYIAASRKDGWLNLHHQPPIRTNRSRARDHPSHSSTTPTGKEVLRQNGAVYQFRHAQLQDYPAPAFDAQHAGLTKHTVSGRLCSGCGEMLPDGGRLVPMVSSPVLIQASLPARGAE